MSGNFGTYMQGGVLKRAVWYTARKISATNTIAGRLPVIEDCAQGDIVTVDPYDFEGNGLGNTVGSLLSASTFLGMRHYIVDYVQPDINRLSQPSASTTNNANLLRQGGMIQVVVSSSAPVLARCKANAVIAVSALAVTQSASDTVSPTKPWLAVATDTSTAALAARVIGLAAETEDTSSTVSTTLVYMSGPGVGGC